MGNIHEKLKAYETDLGQLLKDNGQRMDMVTSSLCVFVTRIGRRSNGDIISLVVVQLIGGPTKRTRKSTKKVVEASPRLTVQGILQGTVTASNEMAKEIKELA